MLSYLDALRELHRSLLPAVYLEIGVHRGDSLRLAAPGTTVIGVDPEPDLEPEDPLWKSVVSLTSDEFFAGDLPVELTAGRPLDLTFIDGLHLFDFVLRDFAHAEALSAPDSLIVIHDVLPRDAETSSRDRATDFWTGDVWKIVPCLLDHRPDLDLRVLDVPPSGLCLVRGLAPGDTTIAGSLEQLTSTYAELQFDDWLRRRDEVQARTTGNPESRAWALRRDDALVADARLDAQLAEAQALRTAAEQEADRLREQLATAEARNAELASEVSSVTAQREVLRTELEAAREEARLRAAEVARLESDLRQVASSVSWRLTAPVRSLGSAFRRSSET